MPNVLDDLAADIYKAADVVGRELTGITSSCTINANGSERVALGGTVRSHFTRKAVATDNVPSMTIPEGTDQTIGSKTLSITKSRGVPIPWAGEEIQSVDNGSGFETIYGDQIAQAMRTLTNEIELDLAREAYTNASRAVGTAGTTPFASNFNEIAQIRQILVDNGCPDDKQITLVMNTLAGTNLRNLASLQKVNESGDSRLLRQGVLLDLQKIMLKESAQIVTHTAGTGSGYLINNASGEAVDQTTLTLDTGTGTILAGDILSIAGDPANSYVVNTALSGGDVVIGDPGLRVAASDNAAVTVGSDYTANIAFHRTALELVMRPPKMPKGGDAAVDSMMIQDPNSGLVYEIRVYKGFQKMMMNVSAAWGYKAWKPDHIAILRG